MRKVASDRPSLHTLFAFLIFTVFWLGCSCPHKYTKLLSALPLILRNCRHDFHFHGSINDCHFSTLNDILTLRRAP